MVAAGRGAGRVASKRKPALDRPQRVFSVSQVLAVPTIADPLNQELCNNLDGEIFKEFMHSKDPHGAGLCLYRSFSGTQADDEIASQMISARRGRG